MCETTLALQPPLVPEEARRTRGWNARVATWLNEVWAGEPEDAMPAVRWDTLGAVPAWALGTPAQLERLTLLAGALFAAPALRVCLDARPLTGVRTLIGAQALERVLGMPGLPTQAPAWPQAEVDGRSERDILHAWGGALLVASVGDPALQTTVRRVLDLRGDPADVQALPASVALRLVRLALDIARDLDREAA